jgi:hypothetical protein
LVPERSSTVKPPPSQPALAAANDRSTAVIVRSATAAAPKHSKPAATRARAITDFFVIRDDLKPRVRFNLVETGKCDGSIIGQSACSPASIRLTKSLTVVTYERRCYAARRLSDVSARENHPTAVTNASGHGAYFDPATDSSPVWPRLSRKW